MTEQMQATVEDRPATAEEPDAELAIGGRIGRYVVLDELGAGGMGHVVRAYDPKLRREVAVKRLIVGGSDDVGRARLMREAQSMAQLSHPNVVPVYDVDIDDGRTFFIAMEFVDGETLNAWLAQRAWPWQTIVSKLIEAGEGLAAAHRQGIVHRDFKPTNVIVGRDGRTRVMDFGLARTVDGSLPSGLPLDDPDAGNPSFGELVETAGGALTALGTVMGTPAYMAPEQHAGDPTDARTDQYAFCVTLWEALHGERPFRAKNIEKLAEAKRKPLPKPPAGTSVPAAVHAAIVRGLAIAPDDRWPDIASLLAALRRAQVQRRPWRAAAIGTIALALGGFAILRSDDAPCRQSEQELAEVWSDATRQTVRAGLTGSGAAFAESTVVRVHAALDDYTSAFVQMHREVCEATRVRHEQSDEALDLRMGCLAARREELRGVVALLAAADAGVAERAVDLATGLSPIDGCADLAALRSSVPPPSDPQTARAVADARDALASARLSMQAGRNADALATTTATIESVAALGYEPVVAETELVHAQALWESGDAEGAQALLESALQAALRLSMRHAAAEAAVKLTALIDQKQGRVAEARWLAHVALALAEADATDPPLTAEAMLQVGNLYAQAERWLDAEPYFRGAVEHIEGTLGPEHPELVSTLASWASLLRALQRLDESEAVLARARALAEQTFGPDHPRLAQVIRQQAWALMQSGQYAAAEAAFDEAKSILEAALGPDHPSIMSILATRAGALAEQGRYDEAAASLQEAERRLPAHYSEDHPTRASLVHNLAGVRAMQGEHAQAVDGFRRAIEIRRRLGMKGDLAAALLLMGRSLLALQRLQEAEQAFTEAERLEAEVHRDRGTRSGGSAFELGKLLRRRGDLKAARDHLETAWVYLPKAHRPRDRAEAALELGAVLWDLEIDHDRARALVEESITIAQSDAAAPPEIAANARAWLASHPAAARP